MSGGFPWGVLGIARTADVGAVRRAYAERLKAMDVDRDPAAYARLRQARDAALRLARANAAPPDDAPRHAAPAPDDAPVPSPSGDAPAWAYAAPVIAAPDPAAPGRLSVAPPAPGGGAGAGLAAGFAAAAPHAAAALRVGRVFGAPLLAPASRRDDLRPVQRPDARLPALLRGAGDDAPLSDADEAEARTCLRAILSDAAAGDLARHDAAEAWLATLLTQTWPRCAPLVEEAAEAMGWTRTAGRLGESKPVAFLNARLAGYLFQRDVKDPAHRFHRAWAELSRPGWAGTTAILPLRLSPLKRQVRDLLVLIRRQFPEIESFLDPRRVSSWDAEMPRGRRLTFRLRWRFLLVWLGIIVSTTIFNALVNPDSTPQPPPAFAPGAATSGPQAQAAMDGAVANAFGPGKTMAWLQSHQPDLAGWIDARQSQQYFAAATGAGLAADVDREVRHRVYLAARQHGGAELDEALRIRAQVIHAARAAGGTACVDFLRDGRLPDRAALPPAARAREQKLAARLAEAGRLTAPPPPGRTRAAVPGAIVQQVMAATGFDRARAGRAMANGDIGPDRCAVTEALIAATLAWHGPGRTAILRTL